MAQLYTIPTTGTYRTPDGKDVRYLTAGTVIDMHDAIRFGMPGAVLDAVSALNPEQSAAVRALMDVETARLGRGLRAPNPGAARLLSLPPVMAVSPTLTYGTDAGNPTIASAVQVAYNSTVFRHLGGTPVLYGPFGSDSFYRVLFTGTDTTHYAVDFLCDADVIELHMVSTATRWQMIVDGQFAFSSVQQGKTVSGNTRYWAKVDFGSAALRRITVVGKFLYWGNLAIGPTYGVYPADWPAGPRVCLITDSYGQGESSYLTGGFVAAAALRLGWRDLWLSAVGGTGFANNNSTYTTYGQRITDLTANNPDVVLVAGGLNDRIYSGATVLAAATPFFAQLRSALPDTPIVHVAIWQPKGSLATEASYVATRDATKAALQTIAGPWLFVDPLTGGWLHSDGRSSAGAGSYITGEGKVGSTTGTGNADRYINSGGTHPQDGIGHDYLGARVAAAIGAALPL